MALGKSGVFLAGAFLFVATAGVAEEFANDASVSREMVSREGQRLLFTVKPPKGQSVDARVFDLFEIDEGNDGNEGGQAMTMEAGRKHKVSEPQDAEVLDLTGYTFRIEAVALANSCSTKNVTVKNKKSTIRGGGFVAVDAIGASAIFVAVYPVQGDVDAYTSTGTARTPCSQSIKNAGQFDIAKCSFSSCNASGDVLSGYVDNPLSSSVQWVGAITVTLAR